jgi:hypothetical protein
MMMSTLAPYFQTTNASLLWAVFERVEIVNIFGVLEFLSDGKIRMVTTKVKGMNAGG